MGRFVFMGVSKLMIYIERCQKSKKYLKTCVHFQEIIKLAYKQLEFVKQVAKTTLSSDLEDAMHHVVRRLQGIVDDICWQSESNEDVIQNLKAEIDSFTPHLKTMMHKCSDGIYNTDEHDESHGPVSSTSEMIGVPEVYQQLKDMIMDEWSPNATALVGMPGIGKTTLANKIFNDPSILQTFDQRVWLRVGKRYQAKHIPRLILQEIDPDAVQMIPEEEAAVGEYLKACLKSKRYLIVLDDVWDRFTMHHLHLIFPYECKESWDLLCHKVFSQGSCPPQLVKAGKKIAENCEGLPLTILIVARTLSLDENKNPEYWEQVSKKENHQIFMDAYDEISEVLVPSYTYLPPLLQMCFMFIGLFPRKYKVPRSKLFNLWLVDGFYELNVYISSYRKANECIAELVSNSLLMVYEKSCYNIRHQIKTCGLHTSLWYLSKKKARETKFALVLSSRNDALGGDGTHGHHRLSFNTNVLFALKDVHKSVEDNYASSARSLFCFAPYLQYQVPLCFRLKLLKELDALSIRFYEFPMEVLQLVGLCYLALTTNGMIPASISQLQCLEYLIVDQHQSIKSCKVASYLPAEIWSLQELTHLQVIGSDLPDPPHGASLSSLLTLSDVSSRSCTNAILEGIPNLENLKIRIELAPDDDGGKHLICVDAHCKLRSFKCVIVNPEVVPPVGPFSRFPGGSYLTNLSLSGLGYPWEEMKTISSLPVLEVLKLKNYAFQGPVWEQEEGSFSCLMSLVIEDTDLVHWKFGARTLGRLMYLKIKQCYKLKEIDGKFMTNYLRMVELFDCNPSCVKELKKAIHIRSDCVVDVHSSWDDDRK